MSKWAVWTALDSTQTRVIWVVPLSGKCQLVGTASYKTIAAARQAANRAIRKHFSTPEMV